MGLSVCLTRYTTWTANRSRNWSTFSPFLSTGQRMASWRLFIMYLFSSNAAPNQGHMIFFPSINQSSVITIEPWWGHNFLISLTDINVFSQHIFACPEPIPKITHCRVSPTRQTCSLNTLVCCFWYFALNTQFVFTRHAYRVHMTEPHLHNHRYKHPHTNIDTLWLKEKLYLTHKHTHSPRLTTPTHFVPKLYKKV